MSSIVNYSKEGGTKSKTPRTINKNIPFEFYHEFWYFWSTIQNVGIEPLPTPPFN